MDVQLLTIGFIAFIVGSVLIYRNRFNKSEPRDMLFMAKSKVFLGAIILTGVGAFILFNELRKLLN